MPIAWSGDDTALAPLPTCAQTETKPRDDGRRLKPPIRWRSADHIPSTVNHVEVARDPADRSGRDFGDSWRADASTRRLDRLPAIHLEGDEIR